ncbi:hypothetical protein M0R45_003790 [Rubus argutus]|uniref:Uncharacterized protein n=1 Tax=Rubus argutus TaxID=59490 RepID=A0AAW1YGG2_RUBAR
MTSKTGSSMPILQRLDRLDRLLQFLEEKHCLSSKHSSSSCSFPACESSEPAQDLESYKTLSSAIEEVNRKGTLMERVAMLENRVLQLSHEMDVENALSSSCSSILVSDQKFEQEKQDSLINGDYNSPKTCIRKPQGYRKAGRRGVRRTSIVSIIQLREWLRWPRMGC